VHFLNSQDEAGGSAFEFDQTVMVVTSADGGHGDRCPWSTRGRVERHAVLRYRAWTVWAADPLDARGQHLGRPTDPDHVRSSSRTRHANPNATEAASTATGGLNIGTAPNYDPCDAGPGATSTCSWWSRATAAPPGRPHRGR
jgi:hypothetical protein